MTQLLKGYLGKVEGLVLSHRVSQHAAHSVAGCHGLIAPGRRFTIERTDNMFSTKRRTLPLLVATLFAVSRPVSRYDTTGLALVVDNLDGVDKSFHSLYVKGEDGKYKFTVPQTEDVTGLKNSLTASREDTRKVREELAALRKQFEGVDAEKVRAILKAAEDGDEAALLKAGKIDEVFTKRTEKLVADHKKQLEAKDGEVKAKAERAAKYEKRVLENAIRMATGKAEMHKNAVDDAVLLAGSLFTLDEEGNAVQLDGDGKPKFGKDGRTPFSPAEWLEERKEDRPHWFLNGSKGGGAGGDKGASGQGKTMTRSAWNALPATEKAKAAAEHKIVDD